jgi:hypothetical protein
MKERFIQLNETSHVNLIYKGKNLFIQNKYYKFNLIPTEWVPLKTLVYSNA